jgi:hypothetical protein
MFTKVIIQERREDNTKIPRIFQSRSYQLRLRELEIGRDDSVPWGRGANKQGYGERLNRFLFWSDSSTD